MADKRLRQDHVSFPDIRTGNGYDVHSFEPGDHVTLCGVKIPHEAKLNGHSDADVGLHALTDALLATRGAGDIGTHFPLPTHNGKALRPASLSNMLPISCVKLAVVSPMST